MDFIDYSKDFRLEDIVYWCENDLIFKTEQWIRVKNYENRYQISDLGRIRSLKRNKGNILSSSINKGYYTVCLFKDGGKKTLRTHILSAMSFLNHIPCGHTLVVDHINTYNPFNKLDNRLVNLRIITQRENANQKHLPSTSKYIGVCREKNTNRWRAQININNTSKYLGLFKTEIEAHEAYQKALSEL